MTLIFADYAVRDDDTQLHFVDQAPAPGGPSDLYIAVTDAEMASVTTAPQLRTLVTTKLQRKVQASLVASKLTPFIGQSVTI